MSEEVQVDWTDLSRQLTQQNIPFAFVGEIENGVMFLDMNRFRSANDWNGNFNDGKTKA